MGQFDIEWIAKSVNVEDNSHSAGVINADVTTDSSNNIYIIGNHQSTSIFRSGATTDFQSVTSLTESLSTGFSQAFIASYKNDGTIRWVSKSSIYDTQGNELVSLFEPFGSAIA